MARRYDGPVDLVTLAGATFGTAHASLALEESEPSLSARWHGHLFPDAHARTTLTELHVQRADFRLRLPSHHEGTVHVIEASQGLGRLLIEGVGPAPFLGLDV